MALIYGIIVLSKLVLIFHYICVSPNCCSYNCFQIKLSIFFIHDLITIPRLLALFIAFYAMGKVMFLPASFFDLVKERQLCPLSAKKVSTHKPFVFHKSRLHNIADYWMLTISGVLFLSPMFFTNFACSNIYPEKIL